MKLCCNKNVESSVIVKELSSSANVDDREDFYSKNQNKVVGGGTRRSASDHRHPAIPRFSIDGTSLPPKTSSSVTTNVKTDEDKPIVATKGPNVLMDAREDITLDDDGRCLSQELKPQQAKDYSERSSLSSSPSNRSKKKNQASKYKASLNPNNVKEGGKNNEKAKESTSSDNRPWRSPLTESKEGEKYSSPNGTTSKDRRHTIKKFRAPPPIYDEKKDDDEDHDDGTTTPKAETSADKSSSGKAQPHAPSSGHHSSPGGNHTGESQSNIIPEPHQPHSLWAEVWEEQQHQQQQRRYQYQYRQPYSTSTRHSLENKDQLSQSLKQTFSDLSKENPEQMEEEAIQRAMELSMLDVAIVSYTKPTHRKGGSGSEETPSWYDSISLSRSSTRSSFSQQNPYDILQLSELEATSPDLIKAAYRKLARAHHPDKGGDSNKFMAVARAYRTLLSGGSSGSRSYDDDDDDRSVQRNLKGTAHWDKQLQDHKKLVQEMFQSTEGVDMDATIQNQYNVLDMLGLKHQEVGSTNRNEQNELIRNSCFYLSLAASYLWGIGAICFNSTDYDRNEEERKVTEEDMLLVNETALQLKRTIESAVVKAHPEWAAQGMVGEEVQAFSDFLVYTLDSPTLLSDWAVVVFDACSGYCDIYKGANYNQEDKKWQSTTSSGKKSVDNETNHDEKHAQTNTITIRYVPGHYQPLIPSSIDASRPSLETILPALDDAGIFYVVTDGNS